MKRVLIILVSVIAFITTSCSLVSNSDDQKVIILSVGIDYKNSTVRDLDSTVNDAKEFGYALKAQYDRNGIPNELIYMIQEGSDADRTIKDYPTSMNIESKLDEISSILNSEDLFVFYYSGHGAYIDDNFDIVKTVKNPDDYSMILACAGTAIYSYTPLFADDLYKKIAALPCRSIVLLDSCYSGDFKICNESFSSFKDSISNYGKAKSFEKISAITASTALQESFGAPIVKLENGVYEQHGIMTAYLLKYLGWSHSSERHSHYIYNNKEYDIAGFDYTTVRGLTLRDLFEYAVEKNPYRFTTQTPCFYKSNVDTYIIPKN